MFNKYIEELRAELTKVKYHDIDGMVSYFDEIIKDRLDNGEKEEDIIKELEDPKKIAASLSQEVSLSNFKHVLNEEVKEETVVTDSQEYSSDVVSEIKVELTFANLKLFTSDINKTNVNINGAGADKIDVEFKGNLLEISQKNSSIFNFGWPFFKQNDENAFKPLEVIIELPNINYNEITCENVSGITIINDLSISNEGNFESVSGRIEIKNSFFNELNIESVSGKICGDNIKTLELNIDNVSGKVELYNLDSEKTDIDTVSGGIYTELIGQENDYEVNVDRVMEDHHYNDGAPRELNLESVSGRIKYEFIDK